MRKLGLYGLTEEEIGIVGEATGIMTKQATKQKQLPDPAQRYRLYVDESGDHVFKKLDNPDRRFLCLIGVWFRGAEYHTFDEALRAFKQEHIPHSPDEPWCLHREDIINRRGVFWRLREPAKAKTFDDALLSLIHAVEFRIVAVVIDKKALTDKYPAPSDPYHLGLGFMLKRYCGFLNHV